MKDGFDRIDVFNQFVSQTLKALLATFPAPGVVPYAPRLSPPEPFESDEEYRAFLRHTITWLVREGIIRVAGQEIAGDVAGTELLAGSLTGPTMVGNHFSLSAKAVAALDVKLEGLDGETPRTALKSDDPKHLSKVGGLYSEWIGRFTGGVIGSLS